MPFLLLFVYPPISKHNCTKAITKHNCTQSLSLAFSRDASRAHCITFSRRKKHLKNSQNSQRRLWLILEPQLVIPGPQWHCLHLGTHIFSSLGGWRTLSTLQLWLLLGLCLKIIASEMTTAAKIVKYAPCTQTHFVTSSPIPIPIRILNPYPHQHLHPPSERGWRSGNMCARLRVPTM